MSKILSDEGLDLIFRQARTQNAWTGEKVSETLLRAVYDLAKWGPTSANSSPARFLFITSQAGKERLKPHLLGANVDKTMAAPVTVIVAEAVNFYEKLPKLFPHNPAFGEMFKANPALAQVTAFRNSSLQGAYLIIAARALGLDVGAMSGFNNEGVDKEFFPDGTMKSNFLCNIGHGDPTGVFPRSPRLDFEEACKIV